MVGVVFEILGGPIFHGDRIQMDAQIRSHELLMQHCNEEQYRTMANPARPHIDVIAKNDGHPWSNKLFRIFRDGPWLFDPETGCHYCINPDPRIERVPYPDFVLTVKLLLETNPAAIFAVSNPGYVTPDQFERGRRGIAYEYHRPDGPHLYPS